MITESRTRSRTNHSSDGIQMASGGMRATRPLADLLYIILDSNRILLYSLMAGLGLLKVALMGLP